MSDSGGEPTEDRRNGSRRAEDQHALVVVENALQTITAQLKWIVAGGVAVIFTLIAIGGLYIQDTRDNRESGDQAACDAIDRLATANERFIRDVAGAGVVTDERIAIYHLYVDPAIKACRQEASLQAFDPVAAVRP